MSAATLRFVCSGPRYSTYEDSDGEYVFIGHGPERRRLVTLDDVSMSEFWDRWGNLSWSERITFRYDFIGWVQTHLIDEDETDDYAMCSDCEEPQHNDDTYVTRSGGTICSSCREKSYSWCSDCEELVHDNTLRDTLHDEAVCTRCRDNRYDYCEHCAGYYHPESDEDHSHRGGGMDCCTSPALSFSMPAGDAGSITEDEEISVAMPAGFITEEGQRGIASVLYRAAMEINIDHSNILWMDSPEAMMVSALRNTGYRMEEVGDQVQTTEGNYAKRLGKFMYKNFGQTMSPKVREQVGNLVAQHSQGVHVTVAFTRDLDLPAEEFGHEDSCWWQSYSEGRCALKSNGGLGMRTFTAERSYSEVSGRSWVMPLKRGGSEWSGPAGAALTPTFDTVGADAYVLFNGYGNLSGYTAARILAQMTGLTYCKISFTCEPMYVNGNVGYLVADQELIQKYTDGRLSLDVSQHSGLFHTEQAHNAIAAANAEQGELTHV